jgi:hypothetical protein
MGAKLELITLAQIRKIPKSKKADDFRGKSSKITKKLDLPAGTNL